MIAPELANKILENYVLCDNCLGRQFGMLGHGLTNQQRGNAIKIVLITEAARLIQESNNSGEKLLKNIAHYGQSELAYETLDTEGLKLERKNPPCHICGNIFQNLEKIVYSILNKMSDYEFKNFLIGIKIDSKIEEIEDELRSRYGIKWGESIKNELSREIGKLITKYTSKLVDLKKPEMLIIVNPSNEEVFLEANPIFVEGMYKKLERSIPQKRRAYKNNLIVNKIFDEFKSIEDFIAIPLMIITKGTLVKLHFAGGEDSDTRILGNGALFIAEVKHPKIRNIDFKNFEEETNKLSKGIVQVSNLKFSSKKKILKINEIYLEKSYRIIVEFEDEVKDEIISKIDELNGKIINQEIFLKSKKLKSTKIRKKYINMIKSKKLESNIIEILINCEGGLYIKEFINGDSERTSPSVFGIIKSPIKKIEIDLIDVKVRGFE